MKHSWKTAKKTVKFSKKMFGDREQLVDENSKIRLTSLKKLGIKIERKVDMMVGRGKRRRYLTYSCGKI